MCESLEARRLLAGVELASLVDPSLIPDTAGGHSTLTPGSYISPGSGSFSADGRYAAFSSAAANLVPGDTNSNIDIFRYDRVTGEIALASVNRTGTGTGNGGSSQPLISADGNVVTFLSYSNDLVDTDSNNTQDVFAHDFSTGVTTLVSVNAAGLDSAGGLSYGPTMSADGNVVAFVSRASNLVSNDTNGWDDVFAYDLSTGSVTLVSMNLDGSGSGNLASTRPAVSADGNVVAFTSRASDLAGNDTNNLTDVFARDLSNGLTTLVSLNAAGTGSGNGDSNAPVISADGTVIAFTSRATNLHPSDTVGNIDVYARDLASGVTSLVSIDSSGTHGANEHCFDPAISSDGSTVVFHTTAGNLVSNDTNGEHDVFAHLLGTGVTRLVSVNQANTGSGAGGSLNPSPSANGALIAFTSEADDLVSNDANGLADVFVHDIATGATVLVSVGSGPAGESGNGRSRGPLISSSGDVVAFDSLASDLSTDADLNNQSDVFIRDLSTDTTLTASLRDPTLPTRSPNHFSTTGRNPVSADGRHVLFETRADNLVPGDNNGTYDVFRYDRHTAQVELVSVNSAGTGTGNGASLDAVLSADGQVVAFVSAASDLADNDTNGDGRDVFVRNLSTGTTTLVSTSTNGGSGNGDSANASLSGDGTVVAFRSFASDLVGVDTNSTADIFARDLPAGVTKLVSVNAAGTDSGNAESTFYPAINAAGTVVVFASRASDLVSNDTNGHVQDVFAHDLATGSNSLISVNLDGVSGNVGSGGPVISGDGNVIAFVSGANDLVPDVDTNDTVDVFARDLSAGTTTLISINSSRTGSGNDWSFNPVVSADGNVVAFNSTASDLVPLVDDNGDFDAFAYNLATGSTTLVSVNSAGTGAGDGYTFGAAVSADGGVVAFVSRAGDLVENDTNERFDVFAHRLSTGETTLVSISLAGTSGNNPSGSSGFLGVNADGSVIAFQSGADDLVAGDYNSQADVFVHQLLDVQPPGDQQIQQLIDQLEELEIPSGLKASLTAKLESAFQTLTDSNPSNDQAAVNSLHALANQVEAQRNKKLTDEQADELLEDIDEILAALAAT